MSAGRLCATSSKRQGFSSLFRLCERTSQNSPAPPSACSVSQSRGQGVRGCGWTVSMSFSSAFALPKSGYPIRTIPYSSTCLGSVYLGSSAPSRRVAGRGYGRGRGLGYFPPQPAGTGPLLYHTAGRFCDDLRLPPSTSPTAKRGRVVGDWFTALLVLENRFLVPGIAPRCSPSLLLSLSPSSVHILFFFLTPVPSLA